MSAEKKLINQIRSIVYEKQADPDQIQALVFRYRLSIETVKPNEMEQLIYSASIACNVDPNLIVSNNTKRDAAHARYMIWKLVRKRKPNMSRRRIGLLTGGQDPTTVLVGIRTLTEWLGFDKEIIARYDGFLRLVENNNGTI